MIVELVFSIILIISLALVIYKSRNLKPPVLIILAPLFILTIYSYDLKVKVIKEQVGINKNTNKFNTTFEKTFKEFKKLEPLSLVVENNKTILEDTQRYIVSEFETINKNEYKLLQSINLSVKKQSL